MDSDTSPRSNRASPSQPRTVSSYGSRFLLPLVAAFGFAALAAIVIPWDVQLSSWARHLNIPGDLRKFIHLCEAFAHGTGAAAILVTLLWIDTSHRRSLLRTAFLTATSGVIGNATKYIIPRYRPYTLAEDTDLSGWATWGTPFTESFFDETIRSFPSGHTATAIALAIGLSQVYPRGKVIFGIIAALASLQRLVAGAHYASDIFASVSIALMVCLLVEWVRPQRPTTSKPYLPPMGS